MLAATVERPALPGWLALALIECAACRGVTADALLDGTGLDRARLAAPGALVDGDALRALVRRCERLGGEDALAAHVGLHLHLATMGLGGVAALTARTLGDALAIVPRLAAAGALALALEPEPAPAPAAPADRADPAPRDAALTLIARAPLGELGAFVALALAASVRRLGLALTGREVPCRLELALPAPPAAALAGLAPHLPRDVAFDADAHRLIIAAEALAWPLVHAEPATSSLALAQAQRSWRGGAASLERVRELLVDPAGGVRSLGEVAAMLDVSPRTLRRHLAAAATSFSDLTDARRLELARAMLADRRTPIGDIAERLGYSDAPNFTRAFRRWTGTTPAQFRRSL